MLLAGLLPCFQSLPLLPTSKLCPFSYCPDADSPVGGLVYVLGPCGPLQQTLLQGWQFLPPPQLPQIFIARGFEALFSCAGTLGGVICLSPQLFLLVYPHANVGPCSPPVTTPTAYPFCPSCPSLPLLWVWMNVSSLTPWLSDFHAVRFSGTFGCFMFLNLLSFLLCEEAKCIYLCLHLGQKSRHMQCTCLLLNFSFLHLK